MALPGQAETAEKTALKTLPLTINHHPLTVEVADNDQSRSQGLSGRSALAKDHGMLFVYATAYSQAAALHFWMPDMHFPLAIIWINADHRIISTLKADPCVGKDPCVINGPLADANTCKAGMANQCPLYPAPSGTQYVLELSEDSIEALNLQTNTLVEFNWPA